MAVSTFDLYKIGIGPSSSHTVGPMRAAARFVDRWLVQAGRIDDVARVRAEVFGSLAMTGRGHGTDKAVMMGLEGHMPNVIDPGIIPAALERVLTVRPWLREGQRLEVDGGITSETAAEAARAGADVLVAGTSIFRSPDARRAIAAIRAASERQG